MEHEKVSEEAHVASSDSVDADKVAAEHRGSWASSEAIDEEGRDLSHLSSENLPEVKATLVLMPNSVIKQWQQTIETQVRHVTLSVCWDRHSCISPTKKPFWMLHFERPASNS